LVANTPCLCNDSSLFCSMGAGTISIVSPGQASVIVNN
jgi:hypothetical protein